ncbi:MAG: DUF1517 domain-containing protein [Microcoleaceae cyanobacterium MO_207.B10]|nr:DUF1517 domain-containing protein [Microcoleaceae cyanobacterium MO_207.B10]
MNKKLVSNIQRILKSVFVLGLILTLAFSHADGALAARSGGRIGGGSFRAPSRTYAPPTRSPGGGYYPGGGFGFPFLLPFFGFGGFGSLFTILIVIAIANFVVNTFRKVTQGDESESYGYSNNPIVSIARVQVGLLAEARSLQTDLDRIAENADTGSAAGRAQVLQEATLSLLRHPEYWAYGVAKSEQARLDSAEAKFNQWALAERSKFSEETLSNYNNQLTTKDVQTSLPTNQTNGELVTQQLEGPGAYIVVTIVVGTQGKVQLPTINSTEDLRRALSQMGSISSEQLLAVEVLWTPQASGDTLTSDDMVAEYPDIKLI